MAGSCVRQFSPPRGDQLDHYNDELAINVGTGADVSIAELAQLVADVVYPAARLSFDNSKPDGPPRKLLDVGRLHQLGWRHKIELREGIEATYEWFLQNAVPDS